MSNAAFDLDLDLIEKTNGRARILVCSKADLHTESRGIVTDKLAAASQNEARRLHVSDDRRRYR